MVWKACEISMRKMEMRSYLLCQDTCQNSKKVLRETAASCDSFWNHIKRDKISMSWNYRYLWKSLSTTFATLDAIETAIELSFLRSSSFFKIDDTTAILNFQLKKFLINCLFRLRKHKTHNALQLLAFQPYLGFQNCISLFLILKISHYGGPRRWIQLFQKCSCKNWYKNWYFHFYKNYDYNVSKDGTSRGRYHVKITWQLKSILSSLPKCL